MPSFPNIAVSIIVAGSLAACTLPPRRVTSAPDAECTSQVSSRIGCSADSSPDTSGAFHDPAMGMDMPTHPH